MSRVNVLLCVVDVGMQSVDGVNPSVNKNIIFIVCF